MKKAAFLDRDGVINVDHGYVGKIEDFSWCDGVFEGLLRLKELGFELVIITNQSGIARGYYSEADFKRLTKWMLTGLEKQGISVLKVYHCPHAPELGCECRKPKPGMILKAASELEIDLKNSILIGDKDSDIAAGLSAGVGDNFKLGKEFASLKEVAFSLKIK